MSGQSNKHQLVQLQKVLDLRVGRAKKQYLEKLAEYKVLKQEADELERKVAGLSKQYDQLVMQLSGENTRLTAENLIDISNRRYWLNYDRELQQYYLDLVLGDLDDMNEVLGELKKAWLEAQAREDAITARQAELAADALANDEILAEFELSDSFRSGMS